jgi:ATP-binding cassette, subfamily F, member 3
VEVRELAKSYGPKQVLDGVNFTIDRGDRIALVGVNGAGKSTLIRMLSGTEGPSSGMLKFGHNVTAEYFAQDQYKVLDGSARMLDDISSVAPRVPQADLRGLLGCFLFSGDDAFKPLGVLSGGERNRYALARILVSPANFLLLDEPTNHLDLRAKEVLLEAIRNFSGTVIFVSHDRYFLDALATRVFEVESGTVHVYPGNYEDYMRRKAGIPDPVVAAAQAASRPVLDATSESIENNGRARRVNPIKRKQMQDRLVFVEREIPRVENAIVETEQALGNFVSADETQRQSAALENLRAEHISLSSEWEELMQQLEEQASV